MNCLHRSDGGYSDALVDGGVLTGTLGTYHGIVDLAATCGALRLVRTGLLLGCLSLHF